MQYIYRKTRYGSMLLILMILIEGFPMLTASAQDTDVVSNVRHTVTGKAVMIMYDLRGDADQEYTVHVTLKRKSNDSFIYTPRAVEGDIGEGCRSGDTKQIIWDIGREYRQGLESDDFYFLVQAEPAPEQSDTWLYIAAGIIVVGGIVVYLLTSGGDDTSSADAGFPAPIGRPAR